MRRPRWTLRFAPPRACLQGRRPALVAQVSVRTLAGARACGLAAEPSIATLPAVSKRDGDANTVLERAPKIARVRLWRVVFYNDDYTTKWFVVDALQRFFHMSEVDYSTWVAFGTDAPVYIVLHDGVPIVSVYQR